MNPLVRSLHLASPIHPKPVQTHTAAAQADGRLEEYFKIVKKGNKKKTKTFCFLLRLASLKTFFFQKWQRIICIKCYEILVLAAEFQNNWRN